MINHKRIAVVMPAFNAEKTLEATVGELPELVDIRILVDDHSRDQTAQLARKLGLLVFEHDRNYGYGRNQQTCYREALAAGADVVIENFSAGVLERWGLDYARVSAGNPGVIVVSMAGVGQTGPWRSAVTFADTLAAMSGLSDETRGPEALRRA